MKTNRNTTRSVRERSNQQPRIISPVLFLGLVSVAATVGAVLFPSDWGGHVRAQSSEPGKSSAISDDQREITAEAKLQIQALISEKESRTKAQQKIDSKVLQAIRENRGETMAPGVTTLAPANIGQVDGWVILDLRATVDNGLLSDLSKSGAEIVNSFPEYDSVRIRVRLDKIEKIAESDKIKFISREMEPILDSIRPDRPTIEFPDYLSPLSQLVGRDARTKNVQRFFESLLWRRPFDLTAVGTISSQGDRTHRADDARASYGHQGEGIKIGVISDSFNSVAGAVATDISSGNLPGVGNPNGNIGPVTVIQDAGTTDEGRAMLQIVHDLAPKAQLYFATANGGQANFANNIIQLKNAGCSVIIDDITYLNEGPFQSGSVGKAVETVTNAGVLYFASAGNAGSVLKNTSGVWEGDFNDNGGTTTLVIPGNAKVGTVHDFDPGIAIQPSDLVTATSSRQYSLYWSDPLGASTNDYDLFVMNAALTAVVDSSTTTQNGSQDPYEQSVNAAAANQRVVVFKSAAAAVRAIHVNTNRGALATFTTGQTHSHSATVSAAFNTAAAPAVGPFPNAFSGTSVLESFSSDGPRRLFYNSNGTAITPGNLLFATNGGTLLAKPDLTAADGVATTFPAASGLNPFFGTSAAAPHAGAIAALLLSANPGLTAAQARANLMNNVVDVEGPGTDISSGRGIIQAFVSMGAASTGPTAGLSIGSVTATEASPSNNNGIVEPGDTVNIVVNFVNPSGAMATGVTATLGPATTGLNFSTVGPVSFGNIAAGANSSNTAVPFTFKIDPAYVCGADIPLAVSVSFGGGSSPISFNATIPTGSAPVSQNLVNLNTTLDLASPVSGPGYTAVTGIQNNRLNRTGVTSACGVAKATPTLQETAPGAARHFDSYTFTNPFNTPGCFTIGFTTTCNTGTTLYSAAYGAAGYNPLSITANYIGDSGVANGLPAYSVLVPAGQQFTVVLHEVAATASGNGCNYTMNVSGVSQALCAAPAAPTVSIGGKVFGADGSPLKSARVSLANSVGLTLRSVNTNSFGFYSFSDVTTGQSYTVSVNSKRFRFSPAPVTLNGELTNLNFNGFE